MHGARADADISVASGMSMWLCMSSSPGHLTRLWAVDIRSHMITQITDLNGIAAEKIQPLISPFAQSTCAVAHGACLACWWWTSEAVKSERTTISKIRAHLPERNRLSYNSITGSGGRRWTVRAGSVPPKSGSHHPPGPFKAVPIDVAPSVHGVPLMHGWIELDELNPTSYWASSADNDTR